MILNEDEEIIERNNREHFKDLLDGLGSINYILGCCIFTAFMSWIFMFYYHSSSDIMQDVISRTNLLQITEYVMAFSTTMVLLFIIPITRYYLFKVQKIVSLFIPFAFIMLLSYLSIVLFMLGMLLTDDRVGIENSSYENTFLVYIICIMIVAVSSFIYGVVSLTRNLKYGYPDSRDATKYSKRGRASIGGYFAFAGITSIIGALAASTQVMVSLFILSLLWIYIIKHFPEIGYLIYLRYTDDYYQEDIMEKPNMVEIVKGRIFKFSTYTIIALVYFVIYIGAQMLLPEEQHDIGITSDIATIAILWLYVVAPVWWILKKIYKSIFNKED